MSHGQHRTLKVIFYTLKFPTYIEYLDNTEILKNDIKNDYQRMIEATGYYSPEDKQGRCVFILVSRVGSCGLCPSSAFILLSLRFLVIVFVVLFCILSYTLRYLNKSAAIPSSTNTLYIVKYCRRRQKSSAIRKFFRVQNIIPLMYHIVTRVYFGEKSDTQAGLISGVLQMGSLWLGRPPDKRLLRVHVFVYFELSF